MFPLLPLLFILGMTEAVLLLPARSHKSIDMTVAYIPTDDLVHINGFLNISDDMVKMLGIKSSTNIADTMRAVTAQYIAHPTSINISIDSPGGVYNDATKRFVSYLDDLVGNGTNVHCYVRSMAASLAAVILAHCSDRHVSPEGVIMVHGARVSGQLTINAEEATALAHELVVTDQELYTKFRKELGDDDYFMVNFRAERLIPAVEIARKFPDFISLTVVRETK